MNEAQKRVHVLDRTRQQSPVSDAEWFKYREESKPKCTGLAILARKHCANFGDICKNCRLCTHRMVRCGYFERAVLPGLDRKEAEKYANRLDVALKEAKHGKVRVARWDLLSYGIDFGHAA